MQLCILIVSSGFARVQTVKWLAHCPFLLIPACRPADADSNNGLEQVKD